MGEDFVRRGEEPKDWTCPICEVVRTCKAYKAYDYCKSCGITYHLGSLPYSKEVDKLVELGILAGVSE